jgi:hypothetical protein
MDRNEKAFAAVQETSKLLMTLATAFIAFTVAFAKDFMHASFGQPCAKGAWLSGSLFLVLSVGCGIWTQLGITTVLAPPAKSDTQAGIAEAQQTIRHTKIKKPFALQLFSFGLGVMLMAIYQVIGVWNS